MYERFTDRARKVMQLANQEAQRFNHEYIGTEHILLGLIKEGSGVAANVLKNLDIDLRKVRLEIEKLVQAGPDLVEMGKLPQTPRAKKVIEYAIEESRNLGQNYVGTEHVLLGLIREDEGVASQVLVNLGLKLEYLREEVMNILGQSTGQREGLKVGSVAAKSKSKTPALASLGRDLTELARAGRLEPLIGRGALLQTLTEVLSCRDRNSPALLGEASVGKTTLVKGLAQAISSRLAPYWLDDFRIVELSFSRLWISVRDEATFDEHLKTILQEVRRSESVVLFLPDGLRFLSMPQGVPAMHALYAEWLDALQSGSIRCILTGGPAEYHSCLGRQVPLNRHCQTISVPPATMEETLAVLRGLRDRYERHHLVQFSEEALTAVAQLADRHLPGALPGKALLLLDRCAARGRRRGTDSSREAHEAIMRLTEKLERLKRDKENAVAQQAFDYAAKLRDQSDRLKKQLEPLLTEEQRRRSELGGKVDVPEVEATIRDLTGGAASPAAGAPDATGITRLDPSATSS
jgi:ATP-dependent Clp protease ATP-binding subunit ClpC